jgi:hypothetical protein
MAPYVIEIGLSQTATRKMNQWAVKIIGSLMSLAGFSTIYANTPPDPKQELAAVAGQRSGTMVTVDDFGAKGDGITDDTAAFRAYSAFLHGQVARNLPPRAWILGFGRQYVLRDSIDLTGFSHYHFEGNHSLIISQVRSYPVIDALGSSDCVFSNIRIWAGSQQDPALVGMQIGVFDNVHGYPDNHFDNVEVDGYYSIAAVQNSGSEVFSMNAGVALTNRFIPSRGKDYVLIEDGTHHWPIASKFKIDTRTRDRYFSFLQQLFDGVKFYNVGGGPVIWMSGARQVTTNNIYMQVGSSDPAVVLYFEDTTPGGKGPAHSMTGHEWNAHTEIAPDSIFQLRGYASPTLRNFSYYDETLQAKSSLLSAGAGVANVVVSGINVKVGFLLHPESRLVNNPEIWVVDGDIYSPDSSFFNVAAPHFQGRTDLGGAISYFGTSHLLPAPVRSGTNGPTSVPMSPNTSCASGQIAIDARYIYFCIASGAWKRAPLDSW